MDLKRERALAMIIANAEKKKRLDVNKVRKVDEKEDVDNSLFEGGNDIIKPVQGETTTCCSCLTNSVPHAAIL